MQSSNVQGIFVSILAFFLLAPTGCGSGKRTDAAIALDYTAPVAVGRIEADDITESSGLTASECQDVLWTHNDAGSGPILYGMSIEGKHLGAWRVEGATNTDWESIASYKDSSGKCFLVIGDVGDNDEVRTELAIYRITEPSVSAETPKSNAANPLATEAAQVTKFSYPDGRNNAETILVHPRTLDIYVVTKKRSGPAGVYKIKPAFGSPAVKAERVGEISVPSKPEGLLTGGSISPDGNRVMLCDVKNGYELQLPENAANPDAIWTQKPVVVDLGDRKQGEGVSYGRDGTSVYASSEKKNTPIYLIRRK